MQTSTSIELLLTIGRKLYKKLNLKNLGLLAWHCRRGRRIPQTGLQALENQETWNADSNKIHDYACRQLRTGVTPFPLFSRTIPVLALASGTYRRRHELSTGNPCMAAAHALPSFYFDLKSDPWSHVNPVKLTQYK